ncbi:MAG: DUF4864 domain-containing protein [Candidatus Saccharibacteria bacterium]|nr:DUF4864 domain-containing protein [Pseudorhodobacter sp.]
MLRMIIVCLGLLMAVGVRAQDVAQQQPIQSTITAQIEALRSSDFDRAFTYASPNIHQLFGTASNFGMMVTTGYPMVVNPAQVEMQDLRMVGGALWQRVRVTDQQGQAYLLDYQMVPSPSGWLINAVQVQKAPDVGA